MPTLDPVTGRFFPNYINDPDLLPLTQAAILWGWRLNAIPPHLRPDPPVGLLSQRDLERYWDFWHRAQGLSERKKARVAFMLNQAVLETPGGRRVVEV